MIRLASIAFALGLAANPALGQAGPPGPQSQSHDSTVTMLRATLGHSGFGPAAVTPIVLLADQRGAPPLTDRLRLELAPKRHRARNALIGGLIGGATGLITCTVISNIQKDPGTGFSTCATSGYVGLGLGGAGLGALIGALL